MKIPVATYRLQFNPEFGFQKAREILSYLDEMGISDIYASPVFKAKAGSPHGYDVVDLNQLNPDLGSPDDFKELEDDFIVEEVCLILFDTKWQTLEYKPKEEDDE